MSVNAGGYGRARAWSRLRAVVNARLEEISFRTGLIAATIALVALSVVAAAGVYAATLSVGGQAVAAPNALSAGTHKTVPTATATAPTTYPLPSSTPAARRPATTATTSPQPTAGSQDWAQADGTQARSRYYGHSGFGHGSRYGGWPGHAGPGFPGQGFGPGPGGFGRP